MRGVESAKSGGVSWPGGAPCTFDLNQVRALGKQSTYGSFVTRYVVRLLDDREVFVKLDEQSADDQAWIRRLSRRELSRRREARLAGSVGVAPTRDCPEVIHWIEIGDAIVVKTPFKVGDRVVRNKAVGGATAVVADVAGTILKVVVAPFGSGGTRARIRVRWDNGCEASVEDRQLVLIEQGR